MKKRRIMLVLLALASCGKEVCRVALKDEGRGTATVALKKGQELGLWTSVDVEYKGSFAAKYEITLSNGSNTWVTTTCDPFDVSTKISAITTNIGDEHSDRYQGKMRCRLPAAPADGSYTVDVKLTFPSRPSELTVKDMSFVGKV